MGLQPGFGNLGTAIFQFHGDVDLVMSFQCMLGCKYGYKQSYISELCSIEDKRYLFKDGYGCFFILDERRLEFLAFCKTKKTENSRIELGSADNM